MFLEIVLTDPDKLKGSLDIARSATLGVVIVNLLFGRRDRLALVQDLCWSVIIVNGGTTKGATIGSSPSIVYEWNFQQFGKVRYGNRAIGPCVEAVDVSIKHQNIAFRWIPMP